MWFLQVNYVTWLALLISNVAVGLPNDRIIKMMKRKFEWVKRAVTSDISLLRADIGEISLDLGRIGDLLTLQQQDRELCISSNANKQPLAEREQQPAFQDDLEELSQRIKRAFSKEKAGMQQLMGQVKQEIGKFGSEWKNLVDELRENQVKTETNIGKQVQRLQARTEANIGKQFNDLKANMDKRFKDLQANIGSKFEELHVKLPYDLKSNLASSLETMSNGFTMVTEQCVANVQSLATSKFKQVSEQITELGVKLEKGDAGIDRKLTELTETTGRGPGDITSKLKYIEGVYARGTVRIVNITETAGTLSGRLEVHYSGRWGTVCDDKFAMTDANVACHSLGFNRGAVAYEHGAYFGRGENDIWFDDVACTGSETDIFNCDRNGRGKKGLRGCHHGKDVGIICKKDAVEIGRLRIVNTIETADTLGGRLEVFYSGRWGTVCDHAFNMVQAQVACHSLGFRRGASGFKDKAYFGLGENDIRLVDCTGSETDMFDCTIVRDVQERCHHGRDVGVVCLKDLRLERERIRIVNITETAGTIGGRLEVLYSGRWGAVCQNNFGLTDAKVACNSLGFRRGAFDYKHGAYFGRGENYIWFDDVACDGSETDMFNCDRVGGGRGGSVRCSHGDIVGIICKKDEIGTGKLRIVNITETPGTTSGRLEVHYSGSWGTVCRLNFDLPGANVACHSLDFHRGAVDYKAEADFGRGENEIWVVSCGGSETDMFQCDFGKDRNGLGDCHHGRDVGVICRKDEFERDRVRIVNITETAGTIGGRLEVLYSDRWGTVCDDAFTMTDAQVACHSLGFRRGASGYKDKAYYGPGENDIWFDDVACDGSEADIFDCVKFRGGKVDAHNCGHSAGVGISCKKDVIEIERVRIANITETTGTIGGRLEVYYFGEWSALCDNFTMIDAQVACRSLGFPDAFAYKNGVYFGHAGTHVVFADVACRGYEKDIFDCIQRGSVGGRPASWGETDEVGVICQK